MIIHILWDLEWHVFNTNLPRFANYKVVPTDYCNTPRQLNWGLISRTNSKEVAMIYLDIKDLQNTFMIARFFSAYFDLCKNALKTFFGSGFLSLKVFYDNHMGLQEYLKLCYQILIVPNYHQNIWLSYHKYFWKEILFNYKFCLKKSLDKKIVDRNTF